MLLTCAHLPSPGTLNGAVAPWLQAIMRMAIMRMSSAHQPHVRCNVTGYDHECSDSGGVGCDRARVTAVFSVKEVQLADDWCSDELMLKRFACTDDKIMTCSQSVECSARSPESTTAKPARRRIVCDRGSLSAALADLCL